MARTEVRSFGGLSIRRPGEALDLMPGTRQRQFLSWLLLAPWGPPLEVVSVCDAMWPRADGDTARSNFSSAVRRLRLLLGDPAALVVRDGTVALDSRFCRTDLDLLRVLARNPRRRLDVARASRLARWLSRLGHGYNPVLLGRTESEEMKSRRRVLGAAWQQVSWQLVEVLGAREAALALELLVCLDRHGLSDERMLRQWEQVAATRVASHPGGGPAISA